MSQSKLDVNNIFRKALGWKVSNKATPLEVRDYILRLAHENGHAAEPVDDPDKLEIKFSSTGKTIGFDGEQWRIV